MRHFVLSIGSVGFIGVTQRIITLVLQRVSEIGSDPIQTLLPTNSSPAGIARIATGQNSLISFSAVWRQVPVLLLLESGVAYGEGQFSSEAE